MRPSDLAKWKKKYAELKAYYKKFGHSSVKYNDPNYVELSKWVKYQRVVEAKMIPKHKELLNKLNFQWSADIRKSNNLYFTTMLRRLQKFKQEHGHCIVSSNHPTEAKLGVWVENQRRTFKKGAYPDWRKAKLDELGFIWDAAINDKYNKLWYEKYSELEKYYEKFGHANVPQIKHSEYLKLAYWIKSQRAKFDKLSQEKKNLLLSLGFKLKEEYSENGKFLRGSNGRFASKYSGDKK